MNQNLDAYLINYAKDTDSRVIINPHDAVGGLWNELGLLQFETLKSHDLKACHRVLDFGCGTLRVGRFLIPYLKPGYYTGLDISSEAIRYAKLEHPEANLYQVNSDFLAFLTNIKNTRFDYIWCHSVFTHLPPIHMEYTLSGLLMLLTPETKLFFTYQESEKRMGGLTSWRYPLQDFQDVIGQTLGNNYMIEKCDYAHPRGQVLIKVTKPNNPDS